MRNIVIIPDEHCRGLYKKLPKDIENHDIIFLGDYLDCYPYEGFSKDEGLDNFKEIIELKKKYPENITLLLGNHDLHYITDLVYADRTDRKNKTEIERLFNENKDLFDIGTTRVIGGKNYSFTHSCVLKGWIKDIESFCEYMKSEEIFSSNMDLAEIINRMNEIYHGGDDSLRDDMYAALSHVSRARGGRYGYGSPVWSHWNEIYAYDYEFDGWYQVYGHSQQITLEMEEEYYETGKMTKLAKPIVENFYACLDCKQLFTIGEDGKPVLFKN